MTPKKKPPFSFVIDYLAHKEPVVKPMFGCYAVYIERKIYFILRKRESHRSDNGVWIAVSKADHKELKKLLPSMRSIKVLGNGPTNWQIIPEGAVSFESEVLKVCEMVLKGDPRIGKIPKPKKKKTPPAR